MAKKSKRPKATLRPSAYSRIGNFIAKIKAIVLGIGNHATIFVTPSPALASVTTHVNDLEAANALVLLRTVGASTTRDLAYDLVWKDVYDLQTYVQNIADDESTAEAINIITLSGFDVRTNGVYSKPDLAVKTTINPTTVKLIAKSAGKRASYEWQQSTNSAVTWINLPTTLKASALATGLTSRMYYQFRFRSVTKAGTSAWCNPVGIVIQ